jgi:hypothetical protein
VCVVQMLARVPEAAPWTAFVILHPSVSHDVQESDLHDLFHDEEKRRVEKVRIVHNRDTGVVRLYVDFENADSLRSALHLETSFRDRPVKVEVANTRENKRPDRPKPGSHGPGRREQHSGIKPTAYDVDTEDADWMARRVQEKLDLEEGGKEDGEGKKQDVGEKKADGGGEAKSNPFGNAKPRDETEYQRKMEEQRKARAEEKRKEAEEKRRQEAEARKEKEGRAAEAGKGRDGGGDWRSDAKPLEPRQRKVETVRVVRSVGKDGAADGRDEHRQGGGRDQQRQGGSYPRRELAAGHEHGRDGKGGPRGEGGGEDGGKHRNEKRDGAAGGGAADGRKKDGGRGDKDATRTEAKKEPAPAPEKKAPVNMFDLLGEQDD